MSYDDYQELKRLRQVAQIFDDTILNGLLDIGEDDLIDSDIEVEDGDRVIGELDDLEKRVHTLIAFVWQKACNIAPELMLDEEIDTVIGSCYEQDTNSIMILKDEIFGRYLAQEEKFPEETWIELLIVSDRAGHILRILNGILMSRFPKEKFEAFIIKKGFQIVVGEDEECLVTSFDFPVILPN